MPFIGFLFNNRIGQIITVIVLCSGAFFTWLAVHDNEIWNKATEAFNQMQSELITKKEEEFKQKTEVINDNAERIRKAIERQQALADQNAAEIEKKAAEETKTTTQVSDDAAPYLKSIVKQLQATYGEKSK